MRYQSGGFPTVAIMDTQLPVNKEVGLQIQLEKTLRDEFVAACHASRRFAV
jgi:hypothetical protein